MPEEKDYKALYEKGLKALKEKIQEFHREKMRGAVDTMNRTEEISGMMLALDLSMQERFDAIQWATDFNFYNDLPPLAKIIIFDFLVQKNPEQKS